MRLVSAVLLLLACALVSAVTFAQADPDTPSGVSFTGGLTEHRDPYIEGSWDAPPDDVYVQLEVYKSGNSQPRIFLLWFREGGGTRQDGSKFVTPAHASEWLVASGCSITQTSVRLSKSCIIRADVNYDNPSGYVQEGQRYEIRLQFIRYVSRKHVAENLPDEKVTLSSQVHYVTIPRYVAPTATPRPTRTPRPTSTPPPTAISTPTPAKSTMTPDDVYAWLLQHFGQRNETAQTRKMSIPDLFRQHPKLKNIYQWDNDSKGWKSWGRNSTAGHLVEGQPYFVEVTGATTINEHDMDCNYSTGAGANACLSLVVW